ncbi:hypothetical protein D3C81_2004850 [compost metagenome]
MLPAGFRVITDHFAVLERQRQTFDELAVQIQRHRAGYGTVHTGAMRHGVNFLSWHISDEIVAGRIVITAAQP